MVLERLELLITSTGASAVKGILAVGAASEEAAVKQTMLQRASTGAGSAINRMSGGLIPAESGLKAAAAAGGVLAAVGIAKFALDGVSAFADLTGTVRAFQRVTGTSAEDASRLVAATHLLGIESKSAETGFFQLGKRIGQGSDTLGEYGAAVARTKDGSVDMAKTMESAAEAFQKIEDPAKRDAFVMENFGRGGAALIPILSKSRQELEALFESADKHHEIFTQEDLEKGRLYSLAIRELNDAFHGFKLAAGQAVIPAVTQLATTTTGALETFDSLTSAVGGTGGALSVLVQNINPLNSATHAVAAGSALFAGNIGDAAKNAVEAIPGIGGYASALFGGEEASNKFADAQSKQKDSVARATELSAAGKTNTKEYRDAMNDAKDASAVLDSAQKDLAASLQTTADKTLIAQQATLAKTAADVAAKGSVFAVADALDNVVVAQKSADDAAQFGIDKSREVEKAHLAVQGSILQVIGAAQNKAVADAGPNAQAADIAKAKTDAQTNAILFLSSTIPGAREELAKLGYQVITLPDGKQIVVTADTSQAQGALAGLRGQISAMEHFSINPFVGTGSAGTGLHASEGGWVPGTGNSDTVPAMLTPGEFVVSKAMQKGTASIPSSVGSGGGGDIIVMLDGEVIARSSASYYNRAGGPTILPSAIR